MSLEFLAGGFARVAVSLFLVFMLSWANQLLADASYLMDRKISTYSFKGPILWKVKDVYSL